MNKRIGLGKGQGSGYKNIIPHHDSRIHQMSGKGIKQIQKTGRFNQSLMRNFKMNPEVYKLRRRVIDTIYDLKRKYDLPRINVRITENPRDRPTCLGRATLEKEAVIWIPEQSFNLNENDLRWVILHELAHTIYGLRHTDEGLMTPIIQKGLTKEQIDKQFEDAVKNQKIRVVKC
jgi:predicted metal-dependent hydrolase